MNLAVKIVFYAILLLIVATIGYVFYINDRLHVYDDYRTNEIYDNLWAQTGQGDEKLPLLIIEDDIDDAYNNGKYIVIYRGLIENAESWDEVALILGHEIAHGTLRHVYFSNFRSGVVEVGTAEANADKMGAIYMMKAGFDVCTGRQVYNRWRTEKGNYVNKDHPDYSYRYDELNVNCD